MDWTEELVEAGPGNLPFGPSKKSLQVEQVEYNQRMECIACPWSRLESET